MYVRVIKRLWGRQPENVFNNTFVTRPLFSWLQIITNNLRLSGTTPIYIW